MTTHTIQVPDMGGVKTYTVNDTNYDIQIQQITPELIRESGSRYLAEMATVTNAVAQGTIAFKHGVPGGIKDLDRHIACSMSGFLAFYVV